MGVEGAWGLLQGAMHRLGEAGPAGVEGLVGLRRAARGPWPSGRMS
ncbi:MAG: hypothetical protein R3F43_22310 [bacterium]